MLIKCLHYRTSTVLAISQPANEWILVMFQSRMREQEILQCAENGDIQSLRFMLLQDRDFSVNCTDMLGRTPLQLAVNNEHQEVCVLIYSWRNRSVCRGIKRILRWGWALHLFKNDSIDKTKIQSNRHCWAVDGRGRKDKSKINHTKLLISHDMWSFVSHTEVLSTE